MGNAFGFVVDTVFSLVLFFFLLRLVLQLSRADFRNPFAQGMLQLTNWLILPLRRVLPPIGRLDTASVVAVLLVAGANVALAHVVRGLGLPTADSWIKLALLTVLSSVLWLYFISIFIGVVISWVAPGGYSPAHGIVNAVNEPVLRPIRSVLPIMGGFDFSPLVALLAIGFVQRLLGL